MSKYTATINWQLGSEEQFIDNKYSRAHTWTFDGGLKVPASAAPQVVPTPMSVEENVDPEEAFVASLSSCHMLWFLHFAARKKFTVESYEDNAEGVLARNDDGKMAMTEVTLRPKVVLGGDVQPSIDELSNLHHLAHENCYIANSVKTKVNVEPT